MKDKYDFLIVGGGIVGIAHAYHLLRAGKKVALVEKSSRPSGATVRNFGQVVPSGLKSSEQKYGIEGLKCYTEIQEAYDISVRKNGTIYIASDEEEEQLINELHQINRENGYPSNLQTQRQCLERLPMLKKDYVVAGIFFSEELSIDPLQGVSRMIAFFSEKYGLTYLPSTTILALDVQCDEVIATTSSLEKLKADQVIICSGSEMGVLYPDLLRSAPIELVQLQMLETHPQSIRIKGNILTGWSIRRYESFSECASYRTVKQMEPSDSIQKDYGVHILYKQLLDGGVVIGDSHAYFEPSESPPFMLDEEINRFMITEAQKMIELDTWKIKHSWFGLYTQTTDNSFAYTQQVEQNVHICTALGGKGMTASFGFAKENLTNMDFI